MKPRFENNGWPSDDWLIGVKPLEEPSGTIFKLNIVRSHEDGDDNSKDNPDHNSVDECGRD